MDAVAAEQELFKACQVIFGAELNISRQFLEYMQMSGVKTAYRQRAKETHPDLLVGQGEFVQKRGARQFQSVKDAYDNLKVYVKAREKGYRFAVGRPVCPRPTPGTPPRAKSAAAQQRARQHAQSQQWQRQQAESARRQAAAAAQARASYADEVAKRQQRQHQQSQANKTTRLFTGTLPQRPMLFGHFLYYSGLIDWQTLVKALIWQRANRPRVGEIGQRFGWLSATDVTTILQGKQGREMFGNAAVDSGKLTASQLRMILTSQKAQQKRIGEYFVRQRIISRRKLVELLYLFQSHNAKQNRCRRKAS